MSASVYRHRARVHQLRGEPAAALSDLRQARECDPLGPTSPVVLEDRCQEGRILLQEKQYAAAVDALDAALALKSDHAPAHRLRAEALLQLERFAEAIESLDHYFARDRELRQSTAPTYLARGLARVKIGQAAEAVEDFSQALELQPGDATARLHRGWAYVSLESPTLALSDFEAVLRLDSGNADALNGRGYAQVRLGNHRAAVQDAEESLRLGPKQDARLRYNAARVFAQAALRVELEGTLARPTRLRYQERALVLLREAIEAVPAEQRAVFWWRTVHPDAALNPIRRSSAFAELGERFPRPASPSLQPASAP